MTGGAVRTSTLRRLAPVPPIDHASALAPDVARALRLVAAELRDMPRDCATDRQELVHWHGRLARRLDAVVASKARTTPPDPKPTPARPAAAPSPPSSTPNPVTRSTAPTSSARSSDPAGRWIARPVALTVRRRVEAAGQFVLPI